MTLQPHVVIIGAGFAGLRPARKVGGAYVSGKKFRGEPL